MLDDFASPEQVIRDPDAPIRVALLNDFEVVVAGVAMMLEPFGSIVEVVDLAVDRPTGAPCVDVALFDTFGRPGAEPERVKELLGQPNVANVAIYSFDVEQDRAAEMLALGVRGYLWKGAPADDLVDALRRIVRGEVVVSVIDRARRGGEAPWPGQEVGLSRRESEILALLTQGLTNREIGAALHLSPETVKTHVRGLFRKLGVDNRVLAVTKALGDPTFRRRSAHAVAHDGR